MKTTYWIAGVLVVGLGAGVIGMANAHQFGYQNGPERISFTMLDTDGDGKLTQAEMAAMKTAQFAKIDTNGDGMLSADEMLARGNAKMNERMFKRIGHIARTPAPSGDFAPSARGHKPEIAQVLDISVEAVESLTARGKRALKVALADRRKDLGYRDDE